MLDQGALVLESITLAGVVQLVVKVLVNLAAGAVLDKKTAEDPETAHPEYLLRHTSIGSTLPLTVATVAAFSSGQVQLTGAGPRVHRHGLADNETIGDELSDRLTGVGVGNLRLLAGVEPDLALAAADDRRGKTLLSSQVDPVGSGILSAHCVRGSFRLPIDSIDECCQFIFFRVAPPNEVSNVIDASQNRYLLRCRPQWPCPASVHTYILIVVDGDGRSSIGERLVVVGGGVSMARISRGTQIALRVCGFTCTRPVERR